MDDVCASSSSAEATFNYKYYGAYSKVPDSLRIPLLELMLSEKYMLDKIKSQVFFIFFYFLYALL
jgi:hypothetical protein